MKRRKGSAWIGTALAGILTIAAAASARAATLDFSGTLELQLASLPRLMISGGGSAQVTDDGGLHLLSFLVPGTAFGPLTVTIPITSSASLNSLVFSAIQNLSGSFTAISGGPPGGGPMGLQGVAKICLGFASCELSNVSVPLTPTSGGAAGFGIGGTRTATGPVNLTLQDAPWTIGQPAMTIHTPNSTITSPVLPGGFVHAPASLTSSTAQPSGVVQLVSVSKVYTSLTGAFPEMAVTGILTLHFVPEPGTALLLGSGMAGLAALGRRRTRS